MFQIEVFCIADCSNLDRAARPIGFLIHHKRLCGDAILPHERLSVYVEFTNSHLRK